MTSKSIVRPVVAPPADASLLTVAETAAVLRLSVSAIRAWILQRRIPFVKLHNKDVRIRRSDLEKLVAASIVPAKAEERREGRAA